MKSNTREGQANHAMSIKLTLDGRVIEAKESELLIDLLIRRGAKVPSVCYHHQLGPIQTCDTCLVEINAIAVID